MTFQFLSREKGIKMAMAILQSSLHFDNKILFSIEICQVITIPTQFSFDRENGSIFMCGIGHKYKPNLPCSLDKVLQIFTNPMYESYLV